MTSEVSTRTKMAQLRLACEQEIRACRERSGFLASSIRQSIRSIKPLVENVQTNRGKLAKYKDHLKELEATFREALKVNASKEAKHTSISEAISAMVGRIEHLKKIVDEQRAKKDEYKTVILQQLLALRKIEEKNEGDVIEIKKIEEATDWYRSVLGFQTVGGEGVKFIFNKIDQNDPDKECWFVVRLDGDNIYTLLYCNPELDGIDELIKELNRTNGLFKFVRVMRGKFQEISPKDSHSIAVSSLLQNSMDSQTETSIENNPSLQSKKHQAGSLHKDFPTSAAAILTPQSIPRFCRRSPRFSDSHSIAVSSLLQNSMDSQTETSIENNPSLQSKKHQAGSLHKDFPTPAAAILTPQSIPSFCRRSPRFSGRISTLKKH